MRSKLPLTTDLKRLVMLLLVGLSAQAQRLEGVI
jgi:hypothetical protein